MSKAKPNTSQENKNQHAEPIELPDPIKLGQAMANAYKRAQPLADDIIQKASLQNNLDPFNVQKITFEFWENALKNPEKLLELQTEYWTDWFKVVEHTQQKWTGNETQEVIQPQKGDRRFKSEEWQNSALFDFIKQSYLLTCSYMDKTVRDSDGLSEDKKHKLAFATKFFADALSPTNFAMTNPDVIRETINSGGQNLVKGFENLIADFERGQGELKISTTNYDAFEVGKNLATTPGAIIYQNDLIQLIQYKPSTDKAFKTPLLIIPPWINKYYILDLAPEKSLIEWAVAQGHTVFTISWANPNKDMAQKRFEDYMHEGILDSLTQIEKITGEKDTNIIGYCLGGTLLSITLSYLEQQKQSSRIKSATFLTTLLDFEHAGDLKLFMDDEQLEMMDRDMVEKGVFEAKSLQKTFSLLRSNDLIWSFVINNYLMGKEPFPFDLLYWNDDSTNMPAAMHSFYLRKLYRDNELTKPGGIKMNDTDIDISKIKTPAYFLSTREDHIAPWKATYEGINLLGSKNITFTLAASGHIAGVVNPPAKNKYCYWTSKDTPKKADDWLDTAKEHDGSWWPHWQSWIKDFGGETIKARKIGKSLEPAPGSYVRGEET